MKGKGNGKLVSWLKANGKNVLGEGLDFIGEVTDISIIEKLGEKIKGDPELTAEQKAEFAELANMRLEELKIITADRQSARSREVEIAKTNRKDWMMAVTGVTGLGAFLFIIYAVIFIPGVAENSLAWHLLGVIETVAISIFSYYFGSSASSKAKTEMINNRS